MPTFSLTGVAKTGTSFASSFINSWSFGLATTWNLFDRDLKIDVELSEADVAIAKEEYRKAVLQAFEETEVALLNLSVRRRTMEELQAQVADLQVVRDVQDARLREGLFRNSRSSTPSAASERTAADSVDLSATDHRHRDPLQGAGRRMAAGERYESATDCGLGEDYGLSAVGLTASGRKPASASASPRNKCRLQ